MRVPQITLGLEEELFATGPSGDVVAHDVLATANSIEACAANIGAASPEALRFQLELKTTPCDSPTEAIGKLRELRRLAVESAQLQGHGLLAVGVPPYFEPPSDALWVLSGEYYAGLRERFSLLYDELSVCGTHVHVGGVADRTALFNALREISPLLIPAMASSPIYKGRDTQWETWRHSLLDRLPRMGMPDAIESEADYWAERDALRQAGAVDNDRSVWGDVRLHPVYPTVEVRIFDASPCLKRLEVVLAIISAVALQSQIEPDGGPQPSRLWVDENKWRTRRYGWRAMVFDWKNGRQAPDTCAGLLIRRAEQASRFLSRAKAKELTDGVKWLVCSETPAGWLRRKVTQRLAPAEVNFEIQTATAEGVLRD